MKVIVAGCRWVRSYGLVEYAIVESGFQVSEIVCGAPESVDPKGENLVGVDALALKWADLNGKTARRFPADWNAYGKSAGPRRNREMGRYADALVAVWDGKSKGTGDMIKFAKTLRLPVYVEAIPEAVEECRSSLLWT